MLDIYKQVELEHDEQLRLYKERLKFAEPETWKSFSQLVLCINIYLEVHCRIDHNHKCDRMR